MTHRSRPTYIMLSAAQYQQLIGYGMAAERLWNALLTEGAPAQRTAREIDQHIHAERESWE